MKNVTPIEERMPHFIITGQSGTTHVIPVDTIKRMASGSLPLRFEDNGDIDDDMIRGIISEWLLIQLGG